MKKTIFAMMAAAALCSCTNHSYTLTGQVAQEGDSVYLLSIDREVLASTAVDAEGKFTFKGDAKVPELVLFATAGQEPAGYLFLEKGEITLTMGEQNDQPGPVVTGTPANDAFTAYDKEMAAMQTAFMFAESAEEQLAIRDRADSLTEAMVDANLTNLFSAYIVAGQYAGLPSNELRELVASMAPDVQASGLVAKINEAIEAKAATEIGQPYIELNLENPAGETVALSSLVGEGKWVLIDFWATWCGPCKKEIPHQVEAYKAFHDKGFEIYGVSLDHDAEAWKAFLPAHEMTWVNVIGAGSEQIEKYAVQSIPSNFLISPEGKIVATQLRGEGVMETLKEFIK